ncbi:glycine-rich RNA-binding protein 4, mitochondrial isoform X1 [Elaeis guineensis]|uniref:glycine-rich RNA-binding protein 4, mitochondrial isoform X1 n=1 Tax=Elaeis guineensis var. tenera TaxID=51953 RepID=UPI003C6CDD3C
MPALTSMQLGQPATCPPSSYNPSPSSAVERCHRPSPSSSPLWPEGLSYDTNEAALNDAFCQHGEIVEVKVICDRITGKSKGYGFVQFCMESEATNALQKMDGQLLDGRNIRVHYAKKG